MKEPIHQLELYEIRSARRDDAPVLAAAERAIDLMRPPSAAQRLYVKHGYVPDGEGINTSVSLSCRGFRKR